MDVKTFRDKHPEQFRKAYEEWTQADDYDWYEGVFDMVKEAGVKLGFEIEHIYFSGFWSQGDGASWVGNVDVATFIRQNYDLTEPKYNILLALIENSWCGHNAVIRRSGHYCHENTMYVSGTIELMSPFEEDTIDKGVYQGAKVYDLYDAVKDEVDDLEKDVLDAARSYACDIYTKLEEEYEYLKSEEQYIEYCECNDVVFDVCDVEE